MGGDLECFRNHLSHEWRGVVLWRVCGHGASKVHRSALEAGLEGVGPQEILDLKVLLVS